MKYIAIILGVILMAVIIIYYSEQSPLATREGMSGSQKTVFKSPLSASDNCTFAECGGPITDMGNCVNRKDSSGNSVRLCPPIVKHDGTGTCVEKKDFTPSTVCISGAIDQSGNPIPGSAYDATKPYGIVDGKKYTRCEWASDNLSKKSDCSPPKYKHQDSDSDNEPTGAVGPWDNTDYASPDYDDADTIRDGKNGSNPHRYHDRYDYPYDYPYEKRRKRRERRRRRKRREDEPYKCECKPVGHEQTKNLSYNATQKQKKVTDIECNCEPTGRRRPFDKSDGESSYYSDGYYSFDSYSEEEERSNYSESEDECPQGDGERTSRFTQSWPTWSSITGLFEETGIPPAESYYLVSPPV